MQSLAHLSAWRGKEETTIGKLLVRLWKKEEENIGVPRDSTGAISGN